MSNATQTQQPLTTDEVDTAQAEKQKAYNGLYSMIVIASSVSIAISASHLVKYLLFGPLP